MRFIVRLFWAFIFFALFSFALNNSQEVVIHWFFGHTWRTPLVIVVLMTFGVGCAFGVLAMVPAWWRHKRAAARQQGMAASPQVSVLPEAPQPGVHDGV